jgi:exopolyphosphatase/guanosine-5'-triphosphate,3'-diphosphate pyrophosphatase
VTTLEIHLAPDACTFRLGDSSHAIPVGSSTIAAQLTSDPPAPEELTNAIGLVLDHLEDVAREVPAVDLAERVEVRGPGVAALADVEVGAAADLPFELPRAAVEDVFRTLATEPADDRRHNPGLPEHLVHDVLGVTCAVVALMRFLQSGSIWVVGE